MSSESPRLADEPGGSGETPEDFTATVGRNMRRIRVRRGYSLERLAKRSGVSRAMLGQIETGKSVPTISLLWKVVTALGVPFATLIATIEPSETLIFRRDGAKILASSAGRFTSRALFPFDVERSTEFYELRIAPHHSEAADAHAPGTRENIIVAHGAVEITVGRQQPHVLGEGDAILFEADVAHRYRNLGSTEAVLYLVMTYVQAVS